MFWFKRNKEKPAATIELKAYDASITEGVGLTANEKLLRRAAGRIERLEAKLLRQYERGDTDDEIEVTKIALKRYQRQYDYSYGEVNGHG